MSECACRACGGQDGHIVLDLGKQPASDYFPKYDEPGPDPVYPLQMWLCSRCGLAQLLDDPTEATEPKGVEPAALVRQAADAIERVSAAGLLPPGARVLEYGSPHGGSWLEMVRERGLVPIGDGDGDGDGGGADGADADVIIDCFGMMHSPDQAGAIAERAARLAPGGVLLLQYHSLDAIIRSGQWNALRHGHYAYYSTTALAALLAQAGLRPRTAWEFGLYGGTVLLAAGRTENEPDAAVRRLLDAEAATGVRDLEVAGGLQREMEAKAALLRNWLGAVRAAGQTVVGYGAASRAVALLCKAQVDRDLLPAVADASPAKRGLRMPGTSIPVIGPAELIERQPDFVLLFVPDLLAEVRAAYPGIEDHGGRWVAADALSAAC